MKRITENLLYIIFCLIKFYRKNIYNNSLSVFLKYFWPGILFCFFSSSFFVCVVVKLLTCSGDDDDYLPHLFNVPLWLNCFTLFIYIAGSHLRVYGHMIVEDARAQFNIIYIQKDIYCTYSVIWKVGLRGGVNRPVIVLNATHWTQAKMLKDMTGGALWTKNFLKISQEVLNIH